MREFQRGDYPCRSSIARALTPFAAPRALRPPPRPCRLLTHKRQSEPASATLEEVVVTAQKREERLQDVPVSMTALSGDQLVSLKLNSGTDIAKYTPNLRISNAGNEDQPKISIRGLSQFDFNLNASSPTGVFYDEVYIASQFLGGPQIYDMQRLEVLRGPQGTLFGKNTVGGAVDYITRAPSLAGDTHAYLAGEVGSNSYYRAEGATDIPLIADKLAARVAFNASQSDGWVENVNPDASARDLSSINNHAFRASLAYENEGFDATLRLWMTRSSPTAIGIIAHGTCPANCLTIPPLGLFAPTTPGTRDLGSQSAHQPVHRRADGSSRRRLRPLRIHQGQGKRQLPDTEQDGRRLHDHLGQLLPEWRLHESGRWRWLDRQSVHPGLLRQDEGVLAGSAPHQSSHGPVQLHLRTVLLP